MWSSMRARRPALGMMWLVRPNSPSAPAHALRGKMSCRRSPHQMAASSLAPSVCGCPATHAALTAPAEVPTRRSGRMPSSKRACSIPTWLAPRLPPPDRTKATRPAGVGSGRIFRSRVRQTELQPGALRALGPKRFHHDQGVDTIPKAPIGLGSPHLVEQRLELRLKIGVRLCFSLHTVSLLRKTFFRARFHYHR